MMTKMSTRTTTTGGTTRGQRMAVALVTLGLGSVALGLIGFKKHQRDADELGQLSRQHPQRTQLLAPDAVHPSERMARWNLLIWTGVGFSYFGVSMGVAMSMLSRLQHARRQRQAAEAAASAAA
jgi:hypothetical protein